MTNGELLQLMRMADTVRVTERRTRVLTELRTEECAKGERLSTIHGKWITNDCEVQNDVPGFAVDGDAIEPPTQGFSVRQGERSPDALTAPPTSHDDYCPSARWVLGVYIK
jgi:hypothetical protein